MNTQKGFRFLKLCRVCFNSPVLLLVMGTGIAPILAASAGTIWNGPSLTFTNQSVTNIDFLTPKVWLTRGTGGQGLFNAKTETAFTHFFSPSNTAWADGTTANTNLTYTDWNTWAKLIHSGPPTTVGVNAVVHLLSEDIYVNIRFLSWPSGGGFVYVRSTPLQTPINAALTVVAPPSNGEFRLTIQGVAGQTYATEISSNLMNWSAIATNLAPTDTFSVTDMVSPNILQRFYRTRQDY